MNVFIDLFYKILLFQIRSRLTIFPMYQFCLASRMMRNPFLENFVLARIQLLTLPSIDLMFIATKRIQRKKS